MRSGGDIRRDIKAAKASLRRLAQELKASRTDFIVDFDAGMSGPDLMKKHGLTHGGVASALFRSGRSFSKRDGWGVVSRLRGDSMRLYRKLRSHGIGRVEAYTEATRA